MKVVIKEKNSVRINKFLDSVLYILGYTLVLLIVDAIFNSFDVDNFWYELLAVVIIYVLNKTVRPIIFKLTIPITALTFGLFYPFINFLILKIVYLHKSMIFTVLLQNRTLNRIRFVSKPAVFHKSRFTWHQKIIW